MAKSSWRTNRFNYISVTSTNRGKSTHKLIENHLNNEDDKSNGVTNVVALGIIQTYKTISSKN